MNRSHFTNPLTEQRELLAGNAIRRSSDGVVEVVGESAARLSWLHSLLSQNLANLQVGESTEALLLDPQGHIETLIRVVNGEQSTKLLVASGSADSLLQWLNKMKFRTPVAIVDRSHDFECWYGFGEHAELASFEAWRDAWPGPTQGGVRYGSRAASFALGIWLAPIGTALPAGLSEAGDLAWQALRINAGRPWDGDFDEKSLPHEFDLLATAVHLSKGCYRGQETVAKVHNLGHPPRRLVLLQLEGSELLPEPGANCSVADKVCGAVLASAVHYEAGAIALALVTRRTDPTATIEVELAGSRLTATQELLVPVEAGRSAPPPKLPRLNLRGS